MDTQARNLSGRRYLRSSRITITTANEIQKNGLFQRSCTNFFMVASQSSTQAWQSVTENYVAMIHPRPSQCLVNSRFVHGQVATSHEGESLAIRIKLGIQPIKCSRRSSCCPLHASARNGPGGLRFSDGVPVKLHSRNLRHNAEYLRFAVASAWSVFPREWLSSSPRGIWCR